MIATGGHLKFGSHLKRNYIITSILHLTAPFDHEDLEGVHILTSYSSDDKLSVNVIRNSNFKTTKTYQILKYLNSLSFQNLNRLSKHIHTSIFFWKKDALNFKKICLITWNQIPVKNIFEIIMWGVIYYILKIFLFEVELHT